MTDRRSTPSRQVANLGFLWLCTDGLRDSLLLRFSSSIICIVMLHTIRKVNTIGARCFSSKVYPSAAAAVADIKSGSKLCVGGFGLCGIPEKLIAALKEAGPT